MHDRGVLQIRCGVTSQERAPSRAYKRQDGPMARLPLRGLALPASIATQFELYPAEYWQPEV